MIINNIQFTASLEDIIAELQSQLKLNGIDLLQTVKNSTEDIMVSCPYHKNGQERRPSAGIRKSDGKFHCFTCGKTHELQEVISFCFGKYDDLLGNFGWKWLNRNFSSVNVEERKEIQINYFRNKFISDNTGEYVKEEELEQYRYYHPYMFKRKLTKEVIDLFDIGWDSNTDCITFPVRDIKGNCLFVARRSTQFKYFNYPRGVEKPVYGLYELEQFKRHWKVTTTDGEEHTGFEYLKNNEVIVCESMLDALTCWVYGKYAVALNGLGNERQFKELRDMPCRKLILATDADSAGMGARQRIKDNVKNKIITEYIWDKNDAKDINDMTKEMFLGLEEIF